MGLNLQASLSVPKRGDSKTRGMVALVLCILTGFGFVP